MKGLKMTVKGSLLTIEVDLSKRHGDSASGKTVIVGSTEGTVPVEGHEGIKANVSIYESKAKTK